MTRSGGIWLPLTTLFPSCNGAEKKERVELAGRNYDEARSNGILKKKEKRVRDCSRKKEIWLKWKVFEDKLNEKLTVINKKDCSRNVGMRV